MSKRKNETTSNVEKRRKISDECEVFKSLEGSKEREEKWKDIEASIWIEFEKIIEWKGDWVGKSNLHIAAAAVG